MSRLKKIILKQAFFFGLLLCGVLGQIFFASAQNCTKADILLKKIEEKNGKEKLKLLNELAEWHVKSDRNYASVEKYASETLKIARENQDELAEADAFTSMSFIPSKNNKVQTSIDYLQKAKIIYEKYGEKRKLANVVRLIGYYFFFLPKLDSMKFYYRDAFVLFAENKQWEIFDGLTHSTRVYYEAYTQKAGFIQHFKEISEIFVQKNYTDGIALADITLGRIYLNYGQYDSAFFYTNNAQKKLNFDKKSPMYAYALSRKAAIFTVRQQYDSSEVLLNQAYETARENKDTFNIVKSLVLKCSNSSQRGHIRDAENIFEQLVEMFYSSSKKELVLGEIISLANLNLLNNNYTLSLKFYLRLDKILNENCLKEELAYTQESLAKIYLSLNDYEKALFYSKNSLQNNIPKVTNYELVGRNALLGYLYFLNQNTEKSASHLRTADSLSVVNKAKSLESIIKYWLGLVYLKKNEEKKALDYFEKSIEIKNELQRKTYNQLAPLAVYSTLGKYYLAKKNDEKARFFAHLSLAETLGDIFVSKSVVIDDYSTLYQIYKRRKMTDSALFYHEKYLKVKDELEKENQLRKITGLEVEAATEKQERENQFLKQKDKLNRLEIEERERNLHFSIVGLAALCLVVFYFIYLNRAKQRANALLKLQKDEISEKNAELSVQKEEILSQALHLEEANSAITKQKNKIEESHREITASITYAQRIQNAVLPLETEILSILPAFFILFCPRDIVSGDFYLIKKAEGKTLIVAADCTGHGVPGAFMSMLGTALLNEIFGKNPHATAAEMLNQLRNEIKKALRQEGKTGEQQDGMDIALCLFDEKNKLLNFAGAHNPLLVFREGEMFELKASRMPIGIYKKEKDFDNQYWECQKNDRFYIFSDGFYSQFHHETRQALKSKALKNLLTDIHILDFEEQKSRLSLFLADWQRSTPQTDDILLIGFSL